MSEPLDPLDWYDEFGEDEWERLERGLYHRLEWGETVHFLEEYLPEDGRILDVGGGAGRYSVWLADRGYSVVLVDPSERQVEIAAEKVAERDLDGRVTTGVGDVRSLPYDDDEFDATLCLGGPLSHVLAEDDRRTAVRELARVTGAESPVFVSVMGRLAGLQTVARFAGKVSPEEDETELLPHLARTGDYDSDLLDSFDREATAPPMHLFRVPELEQLLEGAGLSVETVTGLESVVSQRRDDFDELSDDHRDALQETVEVLRGDRLAADLSGHILAVTLA